MHMHATSPNGYQVTLVTGNFADFVNPMVSPYHAISIDYICFIYNHLQCCSRLFLFSI